MAGYAKQTHAGYLAYDAFTGEYLGRVKYDVTLIYGPAVYIYPESGPWISRLTACCFLSSPPPTHRIVDSAIVHAA